MLERVVFRYFSDKAPKAFQFMREKRIATVADIAEACQFSLTDACNCVRRLCSLGITERVPNARGTYRIINENVLLVDVSADYSVKEIVSQQSIVQAFLCTRFKENNGNL